MTNRQAFKRIQNSEQKTANNKYKNANQKSKQRDPNGDVTS